MAIAWMYRKQYAEAGFQMSTTVDPTGKSAGIQSVMGSILLIGCACALCWMRSTITGAGIASICTLVVSWPMLNASIKFLRSPDDQIARLFAAEVISGFAISFGYRHGYLAWVAESVFLERIV